jgi:hypothetical protein
MAFLRVFFLVGLFLFSARSHAARNLIGVFEYDSAAVDHLCLGGGAKSMGPNFFCNTFTNQLITWTSPLLKRLDIVKYELNYFDQKLYGFGPEFTTRYLRIIGSQDYMSRFFVNHAYYSETEGYYYLNLPPATNALDEQYARIAFSPLIEISPKGFLDDDVQYAYTHATDVAPHNGSALDAALGEIHNSFAMATSAAIHEFNGKNNFYACGKFSPTSPQQDVIFHLNLQNGKWKRGSYDSSTHRFVGNSTSHIGNWTPSSSIQWTDIKTFTLGNTIQESVIGRDGASGNWWAAVPLANAVQNTWIGSWSTGVAWTNILVGDFFGDSRRDLLGMIATSGYGHNNGQVFGSTAFGTAGTTSFSNTLAVQFPAGLTNPVGYYPADLLGEGKKGVVVLSETSENIYQVWYLRPKVTRDGFNPVYLTDIAPTIIRSNPYTNSIVGFMVGRDSTGKESLLWRETNTELIRQLKLNAGGSPVVTSVGGAWNNKITWADMQTVDLNGDGNSDIVARDAVSGNWYAAYSNGSTYLVSSLGVSWSPTQNLYTVGVCKLDGLKQFIVGRTGAGECYASDISTHTTYDIGACNAN